MKKDSFGDRQKFYEKNNINGIFPIGVPVIARIDGRGFSKFTKGMDRPYDENMSLCMSETAKFLVEETNALISYTQSDEITLVWYSSNPKSEIYFGGKMQKMVSQLAAQATLKFYQLASEYLKDYTYRNPTFDARVWWVPSKQEAANAVLWRCKDAVKNSISMAARSKYSAKEMMGNNSNQLQEMLFQKGINWNNYPDYFKRGVFIKRSKEDKLLTPKELSELPPKHNAHNDKNFKVTRNVIRELEDFDLFKVEDKVGFIFD